MKKETKRLTCTKCGAIKESKTSYNCNRCTYQRNKNYAKKRSKNLTPDQRKKRNARGYLNVYVQEGRIKKQPCVICGSLNQIEAHHDDYNKPLDVTWFCKPHHLLYHFMP